MLSMPSGRSWLAPEAQAVNFNVPVQSHNPHIAALKNVFLGHAKRMAKKKRKRKIG
jgi:hypothetical protein